VVDEEAVVVEGDAEEIEEVAVVDLDVFALAAWAATPAKAAVRASAPAPAQVVRPETRLSPRSRDVGVVMAPMEPSPPQRSLRGRPVSPGKTRAAPLAPRRRCTSPATWSRW
jgi:hypothetical protein